MLIFAEMSYKPKEEVVRIKNNLCLTQEESRLYDMAIIDQKSAQEMADTIHKSIRTTFRILSKVRNKIINEMQYENENGMNKS